MKRILLFFAALALSTGLYAQFHFTEIRSNQSGEDNDEYFELVGTAGSSLDGLTFIIIGDDATGPGIIENVTDLTGQSIPADGVFLCAEATFSLSGSVDYTTTLNMESSDNLTFLLVNGFSGSDGDDIDTDNDGTLDATPWTSIVSQVAVIGTDYPNTGDLVYSDVQVGPDGDFVPGYIYLTDAGWQIGQFDASGAEDTPGEINPGYTVDISRLLSGSVSIYPNPATVLLTVKSENTINTIEIFNVIGQKVNNINNINTSSHSVNIESLANGVYLISVENADGTRSLSKFVKK